MMKLVKAFDDNIECYAQDGIFFYHDFGFSIKVHFENLLHIIFLSLTFFLNHYGCFLSISTIKFEANTKGNNSNFIFNDKLILNNFIFVFLLNVSLKAKNISCLLGALLLLVSSTGFSVDIHYCNGEVYDISFFGKANYCQNTDNQHDESTIESLGCCTNSFVKISTDNCLKAQKTEVSNPSDKHLSFTNKSQYVGFDRQSDFSIRQKVHPIPIIQTRSILIDLQRFLI